MLYNGSLGRKIVKRLLNFILVIWGVVTLSFSLQIFTGTDPAEMLIRKSNLFATEEQVQAVRESLGLDASFSERYVSYIKDILHGDLGTAITNRRPVIFLAILLTLSFVYVILITTLPVTMLSVRRIQNVITRSKH